VRDALASLTGKRPEVRFVRGQIRLQRSGPTKIRHSSFCAVTSIREYEFYRTR